MTFQEHMEDTVKKIEDFSFAAISDSDGIIVEEYKKDSSIDLSLLVAEYGTLLNAADKSGLSCETGSSHGMSVFTDKTTLVIRKIRSGFFLIFGLNSEKSYGKARFYARIVAEDLVKELAL